MRSYRQQPQQPRARRPARPGSGRRRGGGGAKMPPKRDSLGRSIKGAGKGAVGQRNGRQQTRKARAAAAPPAEPAASRPTKRRCACNGLDKLVDQAAGQDELEAAARCDAAAAAGLVSCARAHEAWAYYWAKVLKAPPEDEWDGRDGAVAQIRRVFEPAAAAHRTLHACQPRRPSHATLHGGSGNLQVSVPRYSTAGS